MSDTQRYYICRDHKVPALWIYSKGNQMCPCGKPFEEITKEQYLKELYDAAGRDADAGSLHKYVQVLEIVPDGGELLQGAELDA